MNRRTFFGLLLACLGLGRTSKARTIHPFTAYAAQQLKTTLHTSGYLQVAGRDYTDEFSQSYSQALMQGQKAFSNRFLERYEGRAIPQNVVFGQAVGRINKSPYHPQERLETQQLKSITKDE